MNRSKLDSKVVDKMAFKLLNLATNMVDSDDELLVYKQFLRNASDSEIQDEFFDCGFTMPDLRE